MNSVFLTAAFKQWHFSGKRTVISQAKGFVAELFHRDRLLTTVAVLLLVGAVLMSLGAPFDTRTVTGLNPWIKPSKFAVSFAAYFLTLAWLLAYLPGPRRSVRLISGLSAAGILFEMPVLVGQAARGVGSHFNFSTYFDLSLSGLMGIGAFLQMGMLAWALALFCRKNDELPRLYLFGIRAGMALPLLGVIPAIAMLLLRQHNVGVPDGGPALPLFDWSTSGGDLRIAHFLGLHAIQVLPFLGFVLSQRSSPNVATSNATASRGLAIMVLATGLYGLVMLATFTQALAGLPLIAIG